MDTKQFKRVACYVRVSTENQIENYSIDEQIDRLKAYCKAKDWEIYKFYTDGGFSGGNTERPALKKMLTDIKYGKIDMVVVYKLDRLSRSQKDTLTLIEDDFLSRNVEFVSVSENFDTSTAFGRAMIGILSVFAQLEKDQIKERFMMGKVGRAKNGKFHGGINIPIGYDYVDGNLVIDEYAAMQVRKIFDMFLKGYSMNAIHIYMSENYTNKYSNWKSNVTVLNCLKNNIYIGKVKFKKETYDGNHKPIISEEIFYKVQKLLDSMDRKNNMNVSQKSPFKAKYLLSNTLRCARCGAKYAAVHYKYKCLSRAKTNKNYVINPDCDNDHWEMEELDGMVKSEIHRLKTDKKYFDMIVSEGKSDDESANIVTIKNRIAELENQLTRMLDLYQIGNIPIEQITKRINTLQAEKDALNNNLLITASAKLPAKEARELLNKYDDVFNNKPMEEQRMFVKSFVEYIEIDGRSLKFHWRI